MTPIDKTSPTTPNATAPEQGHGGLGKLGKLPTELRQAVVDFVFLGQPDRLSALARVSKLSLEHVNQSLEAALVVPESHQTTNSRLGEWHRQLRTLEPTLQKALRVTAGFLPTPNIFSIDENVKNVHLYAASALKYASGDHVLPDMVEIEFNKARFYAAKAGIQMPDTDGIKRESYIKAIPLNLEQARRRARKGTFPDIMENYIASARSYASKAGIQMPDTDIDEIRQLMKQMKPTFRNRVTNFLRRR